MDYTETSAMNGQNVEQAFEKIARTLLEQSMQPNTDA